jgi:peptidoglycan/LPS O-acetylase OafA/YrhL
VFAEPVPACLPGIRRTATPLTPRPSPFVFSTRPCFPPRCVHSERHRPVDMTSTPVRPPSSLSVPAPDAPAAIGHLPSLDGLRGLAILMVVTHNLDLIQPGDWASHAIVSLFDRGWLGVQLFFVLSGFLITGILIDSRHQARPCVAFFGARLLRILPLYYATLFGVFVVLPLLRHGLGGASESVWWLALFLSNWAPLHAGDNPLPHFWSLAVEEQFYLLWPFLVPRFSLRGLIRFCLGLTVVALGIRFALIHLGVSPESIYKYSVCRIDALACGGAAAALLRLPRARAWLMGHPRHLLAAVAALLLAAAASGRFTQYAEATQLLGYFFLSIGFAALLLAVVCADLKARGASTPAARRRLPGRWLQGRWLRRLGRYSYAMYVLHVPLHLVIGLPLLHLLFGGTAPGLTTGLVYVAAGTLATFVLGALSYHAFEVHFLRLKKRLFLGQAEGAGRAGRPAEVR